MMRAKMWVTSVTQPYEGADLVVMIPVCGTTDANGESEDNTFARYTPTGRCELTINNPALIGKIKAGQVYYVDFTEHVA